MNVRLLGLLQWVGLLLGAAVWFAQHIVGFGLTQAECGAASGQFGISNDLWQGLIMGLSIGLILLAEGAAIVVFTQTRGEVGLPYTRLHFFATAALVANALFLMIVLLDGSATIFHGTCTQA